MRNYIIILILLTISVNELNGQIFSNSPKNINDAIKRLDENLSTETKDKIFKIASDSLLVLYRNSTTEFDMMDEWFYRWTPRSTTKDARLGKYYKRKGLKIPNDMIEVVLRTYQAQARGSSTNHDRILKTFQLRQQIHNEEDKVRFTTDSLRGIYIPENLTDCLKILDELYSEDSKAEIIKLTEDEYSSKNHLFGIGIWMRNNWQLWGGSRLSSYFNKLGINHPEDMSGIIMDSYHRHLKNEKIKLDEQVKQYQEYWKKVNGENKGG